MVGEPGSLLHLEITCLPTIERHPPAQTSGEMLVDPTGKGRVDTRWSNHALRLCRLSLSQP